MARGLQGCPAVGRTPRWLPWVLALLVALAVVAFLVALQQAGL